MVPAKFAPLDFSFFLRSLCLVWLFGRGNAERGRPVQDGFRAYQTLWAADFQLKCFHGIITLKTL